MFDVWCDVPPDKDKCPRKKIATLPLLSFDYFGWGQMLTWPRWFLEENRNCSIWYFWQFQKVQWWFLSTTQCVAALTSNNDVDDELQMIDCKAAQFRFIGLLAPPKPFIERKKSVDNKPCPFQIWASSEGESSREKESQAIKWPKKGTVLHSELHDKEQQQISKSQRREAFCIWHQR